MNCLPPQARQRIAEAASIRRTGGRVRFDSHPAGELGRALTYVANGAEVIVATVPDREYPALREAARREFFKDPSGAFNQPVSMNSGEKRENTSH